MHSLFMQVFIFVNKKTVCGDAVGTILCYFLVVNFFLYLYFIRIALRTSKIRKNIIFTKIIIKTIKRCKKHSEYQKCLNKYIYMSTITTTFVSN